MFGVVFRTYILQAPDESSRIVWLNALCKSGAKVVRFEPSKKDKMIIKKQENKAEKKEKRKRKRAANAELKGERKNLNMFSSAPSKRFFNLPLKKKTK